MSFPVLLGLLIAQRLAELWWGRRNARLLTAAGWTESGAGHYPLVVALHLAWFLAMVAVIPPDRPAEPVPLALYGVLLAARAWVMASLGRFWTTRVLSRPGAPLVTSGPYRWLRHPNYLVVAGEIAVVPLVFDAWGVAVAFSALNGMLLAHRVGVENAALTARGSSAAPG